MEKRRRLSTNEHNSSREVDFPSTTEASLYLNSEQADVHFIFTCSDERVPAHKSKLSSRSDVFDAMFFGSLKEEGDIKIVDSTPEAFKEFLRFFYFNEVDDVSLEHVSDVMYLSNKYHVDECYRSCANLLESSITDQTVISTLHLAIFHEHQHLQRLCESFIDSKLDRILKSENFVVCDRRVLGHILKMNRLASSEMELFEACMSWVRSASGEERLTRDIVRTHLGDLFYEIRFGVMTFGEFAKLLPVYGEWFTTSEYNEILRMISGQERKPKIFTTCRRLLDWDSNKVIVCNRFVVDGSVHRESRIEEVTRFFTSTWLLLGHFTIAARVVNFGTSRISVFNRPADHINATIIVSSTKIVTEFKCKSDYSIIDGGYKVDLPTPIAIMPKSLHEIRIKFQSNDHVSSRLTFSPTERMANGISVRFYGCMDDDVYGRSVGVIRSLGFNAME